MEQRRWVLDLCFKAQLSRFVEPNEGEVRPFFVGASSTPQVVIYVVTEPPFGSVVPVEFDPKLLRLRQTNRDVALRPKRRMRGLGENSYGPNAEALFRQPGLNNLTSEELASVADKFREHLQFAVLSQKEPVFYRCTSLGSLYEAQDVVLYMPPADVESVLKYQTPTKQHLPTEPTLYPSTDHAILIPTLLLLWAGDDSLKDAAVALESGGVAMMAKTRAVVSIVRDSAEDLPNLKGTIKQVAWASEIRGQVVEALRAEAFLRKLAGFSKVKVTTDKARDYQRSLTAYYVPGKPELKRLLEEVRHAEDAEAWINHRFKPFEWLSGRSKSRVALDTSLIRSP